MLCSLSRRCSCHSRLELAVGFVVLVFLHSEQARGVYPAAIWGHVGTVDYFQNTPFGSPESVVGWRFWTSDSDEFLQFTNPINASANPFPDGPHAPFTVSFGTTITGGFASPNAILANDLGGFTATSNDPLYSPFFGSDGNNAYAVAFLDDFSLKSYFQIRKKGSTARISDSTLANNAVALGLWSGVDDYIEFEETFAFYSPNTTSPNSPSDYSGLVFPEPSSSCLVICAASSFLIRR